MVAGVGRLRGATPELLVLAGIACLFLFQALLSLLQFLASPEALQQIVFWLFGSLQRSSMAKVGIVALVFAATLPVVLADARRCASETSVPVRWAFGWMRCACAASWASRGRP